MATTAAQPLPMPLLPPIPDLEFHPDAHRYRYKGDWLLYSVTQVVSDLDDKARKRIEETKHIWEPRGNAVHEFLESFLIGEALTNPGDYTDWTNALLGCWIWEGCEVLAAEYRLVDPIKRVAGSFDGLIKTAKGTTCLFDLKTVSSAPAAKSRKPAEAQLGAYRSMLATHHPYLQIDKCLTIVVGPGACEIKTSDPDACVAQWVDAWDRHVADQELLYAF